MIKIIEYIKYIHLFNFNIENNLKFKIFYYFYEIFAKKCKKTLDFIEIKVIILKRNNMKLSETKNNT